MNKIECGIYDTFSTECAAALHAVGCETIQKDPIRRIFTERKPCNQRVAFGLARGGQVQYRFKETGSEFDTPAPKLAQAYADERHTDALDNLLMKLREQTAGSAAGQTVELIIQELPLEIMRYIRVAMAARRMLINEIATRENMTELVAMENAGNNNDVLHHSKCPPHLVQKLLQS